jgi:hypothetical protein
MRAGAGMAQRSRLPRERPGAAGRRTGFHSFFLSGFDFGESNGYFNRMFEF